MIFDGNGFRLSPRQFCAMPGTHELISGAALCVRWIYELRHLFSHLNMGSWSGDINNPIDRACPGTLVISPFFSSLGIIW
jgi:hypothetical protein